MKSFLKFISVTLLVAALCVCTSAAKFEKTLEYKDDTFNDVPQTQWYASEVKSAYELGFMNGVGDKTFDPNGNVTVSAGITMACRVHAIYNGVTINTETKGKWYEPYVNYALDAKIIENNQFDDYDRPITRVEMATLFAGAMPDDYFVAENKVTSIPDVAETEEYYNDLIKLYNAGVVMGSDEYGSFYPNNSIKRSETAAIINRVAIPENRLTKTLADYGDRPVAHFLIDDFGMIQQVKSLLQVRSGWNVDDRISNTVNKSGAYSNVLNDTGKGYVSMNRYVTTANKGIVVLESIFSLTGDGARIYFNDSDEKTLVEVRTAGGTYHVIGKADNDTKVAYNRDATAIRLTMNLDTGKAVLVVNGKEAGTYDMADAKDISRMFYATTEEAAVRFIPTNTHLYTNYVVHDVFRIDNANEAPYGWTATGNAKIAETQSASKNTGDNYSVKIDGNGTAQKKFDAVSGKFIYETQLVLPEYAKADFSLMSGAKAVLTVTADKTGKFVSDGKDLRKFTKNVWQTIRVEGDTVNGEALIKINGKSTATVKLDAKSIDGINISFDNAGKVLWFDDVLLYNYYDYVDYCPTPVPTNDDEWIVGMSVCSLWHEGTHFGWFAVTPYDEIMPVLGYYDEGLTEVADWEIKFMVEHGVDFQHFCWYNSGNMNNQPMKYPRLAYDALNNGYFNAKYSDMMKFCIMWENASQQDVSKDFYTHLWNYWVDWYFTDDRYMTIDNKAVLTIYRYNTFVESMGGEEAAKKAVEFMDTELKKLGYDGLLLMFSDTGKNAELNKKMAAVGADALISYTFGEHSYLAGYQKDCMLNAYKAGGIDLVPCVGVGFNDLGWTGERTPNASIDEHYEAMKWSRDTYLPMLGERDKNNDWKSKFVFLTTWNEYGEGHYMMPANLNKFGYMDNVRKVFSSAADETGYHSDVEPTDSQLERLGYIYHNKNTPMRKQDLVNTEAKVDGEKLIGYDLAKKEETALVKKMMNISEFAYDESEKALKLTSTTTDPAFTPVIQPIIKSSDAQYLHVVMKSDHVDTFTMYFKNFAKDDWSAKKCFVFSVFGDNEYHDYYVKLDTSSDWAGDIAGVRFDPISTVGSCYIKSVEFITPSEDDRFFINVDGTKATFDEGALHKEADEVYVAANPAKGFYTLHNTYYEFDRWNNTLLIRTPNGVEMCFTAGSDKVLVDGKEKTLKKQVEMFDGLVVLPVYFIYDNGGFDYKKVENGIEVTVREGNYIDILNNRKPNEFEFDIDGDNEGWSLGMATGSVYGGCYVFDATPADHTSQGFDAQMVNGKFQAQASLYNGIEIRMRYSFAKGTETGGRADATIYFKTTAESSFSEAKTLRADMLALTPDKDGFITLKLDATKNEKWNATITGIRFDPTNYGGTYEIDYIRLIPDPEAAEKIAAAEKAIKEKEAKLMAADKGEPFYVHNATGDLSNDDGAWYSNNAVLSTVDDPLRSGNKVILVKPDKNEQRQWVYAITDTRFKPGVTYKVEFDYYVVGDHNGNPVENVIPQVNFRYSDVKDGVMKANVDHNKSFGKFSTKDGWVRCEFIHKINETSTDRSSDHLTFFTSPLENGENFQNISYMLDNIIISVVE